MPIADFNGKTFVAFLDISGFKEMMKGDGSQAINAIDKLNVAGYEVLRSNRDISGFFISDCGVLFVKNEHLNKKEQLLSMLKVVKNINKSLIIDDIMTTTSISYGHFSYHNRIEFNGISKNPIYGDAYVTAFLDNENGTPKLEPGQCRIVFNNNEDIEEYNISLLKKTIKHYYYYWMLEDEQDIENFKKDYTNSYKLKYTGMLSALKRNLR
ncbi:hypothetical protein N5U05_11585 [Aliarcobacter butzleri]|uniref:hypothetical protein n=1 Tax=Aliarcobacter butzleri TaxID=28197 RepID=UPI0021B17881|nr:hypothetical protein [Aliarcobacter butzleri]MCT7618380.1 hypothetical protein [Aliarcobacter butzleri]